MEEEELPDQVKNGGIACLSASSRRRQGQLKKLLSRSDSDSLSGSLWEAVRFYNYNKGMGERGPRS